MWAMNFVAAAAAMLLLLPCTAVRAQAPAGFVDAAAVVPGLVVDMRYFGDNNFVGERIDGYERPRCLLTAQAAEALARVQRDLSSRGLGLKVFDCYRPARAVAHFLRWAKRIDDVKKAEFHPDISKRDLFETRVFGDPVRTLARFDRGSHAGAARGPFRARHGHDL